MIHANFAWRSADVADDKRMLSYREALDLLLKNSQLAEVEHLRIDHLAGRVLRQTVVADRPFPAFHRVMMDGYAVKSRDWQSGQRFYQVVATAPAGRPVIAMPDTHGLCIEVMTGAPCPHGADLIIPVENVVSNQMGVVQFPDELALIPGRFIHVQGSDAPSGAVLLEPGCVLGAREIGVAASCGAEWLDVSKNPKIAVIATGDELVGVGQTPEAHQIRQSNGYSIAAALTRIHHPPAFAGVLEDDMERAHPILAGILASHDWLILTGAVSKGSRDYVPLVLTALGCRPIFHGVAQRPGKPAGFWVGPNGQPIMALPGNPVSALTAFHAFVLPALAVASGLSLPPPRLVILEGAKNALLDFTWHLPVRLRADGRAEPAATGNSGDFIGLLKSDGFVTIPPRGADAAYPYTPWL